MLSWSSTIDAEDWAVVSFSSLVILMDSLSSPSSFPASSERLLAAAAACGAGDVVADIIVLLLLPLSFQFVVRSPVSLFS